MGEVYVAQMTGAAGFEKQVVIKRILPQLARDEQFVRMFLDEARITAQLNHPNICQVFELGEVDGEYYIAMEYLEGLSLASLISRHAPAGMDLRVVAGIMVQACEGLGYAHDFRDDSRGITGVVHRDVSPQNLFVTAPGLVKVLDFGVAKLRRDGATSIGTGTKGKYLYLSPEQVRNVSVDHRSDVFSLATVMFEAITGQTLFARSTEFLTLQAIAEGNRPSLREFRPDAPPALEAVLDRALSMDREHRYPSAQAMAEALTFSVSSIGGPASIIELARFVSREYTDVITSTRESIRRVSERVQSDPGELAAARTPSHRRLALDDDDEGPTVLDDEVAAAVADEIAAAIAVERASAEDLLGLIDDAESPTREFDRVLRPSTPIPVVATTPASAPVAAKVSDYPRADGWPGPPTTIGPADSPLAPSPLSSVQLGDAADFSLRPAPARRILRWTVIALLTLAALAWFGRDLLPGDLLPGGSQSPPAPAPEARATAATDPAPAAADDPPTAAALAARDQASTDDAPRGDGVPAAASDDMGDDDGGDGAADETGADEPGATAAAEPTPSKDDDDADEDAADDDDGDGPAAARARSGKPRRTAGGFFTVDASPYAEIYIDGKKAGITPLVGVPLASGRHTIKAVAANGEVKRFRIRISPKKTTTRRVQFSAD